MDATPLFKGKKVTLMRLGLLGRGVGDAAFLARSGAEVLVVDSAPQEQMQKSVDALKENSNVTFKFGPYDLADFRSCDLVIKGAGTPLNSPEIQEAHTHGIPVRMSADLFAEHAGIPVIGVTGTRGKSTVTHLIETALKAAGKKVLVGGNVRGISTLALLEEVTGDEIAVLELDSWQLQGFGEASLSPSVAVFTTFFPDHLNYYEGDLDKYLDDKAQIFLYQKPEDTLVLGGQVAPLIHAKYGERLIQRVVTATERSLPSDWKLAIPGVHNRYNAAIALAALDACGISADTVRDSLESFRGVEGRLELVREVDGVSYYNDTNATTPEASIAALEALGERHQGIVLITGGADKGLEMDEYVRVAEQRAKHINLLSGTGTDRIRGFFPSARVFTDLKSAFDDARTHATSGDAVLLTPAFASFGMFRNEYDRGDQFLALVRGL